MQKILLVVLILLTNISRAQLPATNESFIELILSAQKDLQKSDLAEMKLSSRSKDKSNGITHYYFNQYYKTIPVHNAVLGLHLYEDGSIATINHTFQKNIASFNANLKPAIQAIQAVTNAMNAKQIDQAIAGNKPSSVEVSRDDTKILFRNETLATGDIIANLCWLPLKGDLKLCWNINWLTKDGQNWWNIRISAETGEVMDENNWMNQCHASDLENTDRATRMFEKEECDEMAMIDGKSNAKYNVLPMPVESPNHGNRQILNDPSDSLASPYSWHDVNGSTGHEYTITRGNNVYAYEDTLNLNFPGYSPDGGSNLNFDYAFDITKSHPLYLDAAITNLFYWNNLMHDVWYQYGFDDESGNFQVNNYGRGGDGNDEVMAEAQDGSGKNNANFGTPPDGSSPRMQMYKWTVNYAGYLLRVTQPSNLVSKYIGIGASFGPPLTKSPINAKLILIDDGSANPSLGCNWPINGSALNGQIALIDRGTCLFGDKILNAQNNGAVAVVIINNVGTDPIIMSYSGGTPINIPSIMISKASGDSLKKMLQSNSINVSLYDSSVVQSKDFDSDFDNGIICHEYGHGISNRLTGGPANSGCLSSAEQMGEGWSDFFSLVMTHESGDKGTDQRGVGTYDIGQPIAGIGIRNYPYSTDMSINPSTYDYIKTHTEVHDLGSVWCEMLWDLYWDFIDKYGYDPDKYKGKGGNNMVMKMVIDGMKLQPCSPGFVDGRDAILLADRLNNKGKNQGLIWKTFARRGLGYSADQGWNDDATDGTEAFDVPDLDLPQIFIAANDEADKNNIITYKITLKNPTPFTLKQLTLTDTIKSDLQFIKSTLVLKDTFIDPVYTANIDSMQSGDSIVFEITAKVVAPVVSTLIETTNFENNAGNWKDSIIDGVQQWDFNTFTKHKGNKSYFIPNTAFSSDNVLTKTFNLNLTSPYLVFYHFYNTNTNFDGAVVEIFNNGMWEDLSPQFIENGYNTIINAFNGNSLAGREAFSGNSQRFIRSVIDLKPYKGKFARIRFRFASDGFTDGEGWYIDDISLSNNYIKTSNRLNLKTNSGGSTSGNYTTWLVDAGPINIKHIETSDFKVIPNPFSDAITIQTKKQNYNITLTDILGKVVLTTETLSDNQMVKTSDLPPGAYILKMETSTGVEVVKLVKW